MSTNETSGRLDPNLDFEFFRRNGITNYTRTTTHGELGIRVQCMIGTHAFEIEGPDEQRIRAAIEAAANALRIT